ncbi:YicC/YloC family endoribonuclease [Fuchsiella alkaliacetigena]|uniref:YicC/YloC family endoribonuclease n=1 Tax=Fuchsiella alkaliacetigena TaxID=957042 RepID=UPI002009E1C2|nr:YicC/YloC family endoribonuclease [Fuchsiella alkaliacetigena]MCK8824235.1 YicC family protein [Fuchsiella alkaliacetigena]
MLRSMTGYGRAQLEAAGDNITVELKSVNHKYQKINLHIPEQLSALEARVDKLLKTALSRGRINYNLELQSQNKKSLQVQVNRDLAAEYVEHLEKLQAELGLAAEELSVEFLAELPDVLTVKEIARDIEELWPQVEQATEEALAELLAMRKREGEELLADFLHRLEQIEDLVTKIEARVPEIVTEYQLKLKERIEELAADYEVDEDRLAMETALIADKSDVNEELIRLKSHVQQFEETLRLEIDEPVGRKLDFIAQEMHREVNTIGSKISDSQVANYVVELKSEVDRIREQLQNVE